MNNIDHNLDILHDDNIELETFISPSPAKRKRSKTGKSPKKKKQSFKTVIEKLYKGKKEKVDLSG